MKTKNALILYGLAAFFCVMYIFVNEIWLTVGWVVFLILAIVGLIFGIDDV